MWLLRVSSKMQSVDGAMKGGKGQGESVRRRSRRRQGVEGRPLGGRVRRRGHEGRRRMKSLSLATHRMAIGLRRWLEGERRGQGHDA